MIQDRHLSQNKFAALMGFKAPYVTQLKRDGRLVMTDDGKVDVEASKKRLRETKGNREDVKARHDRAKGIVTDDDDVTEGDAGDSFQKWRAMKEKYNALLARTEHERETGQLLPRDEAFAAVEDAIVMVRNSIENFPNTVASLLVGKQFDEIRSILRQEIETAIQEANDEAVKEIGRLRGRS